MTFKRKSTNSYTFLYLLFGLLGIGLLYLGTHGTVQPWKFLSYFLGGYTISMTCYSFLMRSKQITELSIDKEKVVLKLKNGTKQEIALDDLTYTILVKKYIEPIRALELRKKPKLKIGRGKLLGKLTIRNWPELKSLSQQLILLEVRRKSWRFGWSFGEFVMLVSILAGTSDNLAANFVNDFRPELGKSLNGIGAYASDERGKTIQKSQEAEKKFLDQNEKKQ